MMIFSFWPFLFLTQTDSWKCQRLSHSEEPEIKLDCHPEDDMNRIECTQRLSLCWKLILSEAYLIKSRSFHSIGQWLSADCLIIEWTSTNREMCHKHRFLSRQSRAFVWLLLRGWRWRWFESGRYCYYGRHPFIRQIAGDELIIDFSKSIRDLSTARW